jgi:hypothetical protein
MRSDERVLEVPTVDGESGAAEVVGEWVDKWVQVEGTFSATITICGLMQASSEPIEIATVSAPETIEVKENVHYLFARTDSYASGEPRVIARGREARTY